MFRYSNPLTVIAFAVSFSKKYEPITSLDQKAQQTVTQVECKGFSTITLGFSKTQMLEFIRQIFNSAHERRIITIENIGNFAISTFHRFTIFVVDFNYFLCN